MRQSPAERRARRAEIDDPNAVLEAALRFLEVRQRSVAEVRRRLTRAGYREDLVAGVIARLGDLGMLDDEAFAAQWVESRDRARPRGERALRAELRWKGVDASTIDLAMIGREGGGEPDPDDAAADRFLASEARTLGRIVDPRQRRNRAYAALARRGFDADTSTRAIRRAESAAVDGSEDLGE
ncbi:MAG TPA: regulatory protein RecX [Candidatus Sulfomarinibacteraceae bacterium]|nr:regulatory protein RecX [Candidatus Sulfomarinibacteraceae bacterium]